LELENLKLYAENAILEKL